MDENIQEQYMSYDNNSYTKSFHLSSCHTITNSDIKDIDSFNLETLAIFKLKTITSRFENFMNDVNKSKINSFS